MNEKVHGGKLIKEKMRKEGRKIPWLADKVSCDRTNIYRIYKQQHVDPELLTQICIHLEIDLFAPYSEFVCAEIQKKRSKK